MQYIVVLSLCLYLLLAKYFCIYAQFGKDVFGKNRLQHRQFEWKEIESANFNIFYYGEGYEIAKLAAQYAESEFPRITDLVGYAPYQKVKMFVYLSVNDLRQSNVGVSDQGVDVGGQTHFFRSQIEVAYTGNKYSFKAEITRAISDILIFEMMYGGSLKDVLKNSYLMNLPEWFMAGAAKYIAEGWSEDMDDFIRDAVSRNKLKKPESYQKEEATLIGQSLWNFIVQEHNSATIANILNMTRLTRKERQAIEHTLRKDYKTILKNWKKYYTEQYRKVKNDLEKPPSQNIIVKNRRNDVIADIMLSPDGKKLAYALNRNGKYRVVVKNLENKSSQIILRKGFRVMNQRTEKRLPLLAWQNNDVLVIFSSKNGKHYFWFYDFSKKTNRRERILFDRFAHIHDFSISADGKRAVFSAERKGKSDIYIYHFASQRLTQITNDGFDDLSPTFVGNSNRIIFTSNRQTDSINAIVTSFLDISDHFSLFLYDPAQPELLTRLTKTLNTDSKPIALADTAFLFLSDQKGITQLFKYSFIDSTVHQITKYYTSIKNYSVTPHNKIAFCMLQDDKMRIFLFDTFNLHQQNFTIKTYRQEIRDLKNLETIKQKNKKAKAELEAAQQLAQSIEAEKFSKLSSLPPDEVDTDNYEFSNTAELDKRKTFLNKYNQLKNNISTKEVKISKSQDYKSGFTLDNSVTSFYIDALRGFGLVTEVSATDILENHKFNGGLYGILNRNNTILFAEYEYLKRREDIRIRYDRSNLNLISEERSTVFNHQYQANRLETSFSYPFNITTRFTIAPVYSSTRFINASITHLDRGDVVRNYAGGYAELVFDNSIISGINMRQGTRLKIRNEFWRGLKSNSLPFQELTIDFRNYLKLHKTLVLATRSFFGQFSGKSPKYYFLGGMENWIFRSFDYDTEYGASDPLVSQSADTDLSYLMFSRFVTNMRGFNFNRMNGNSVFLWNTELRFPVAQYFYQGNINSNFLRNLQLVGFVDIGSAWRGSNPFFNPKNSISTRTIESGAFRIEVTDYRNPFIIGYGVGIRSTLFGYYTKLDIAVGELDGIQQPIKAYLSIGYDF
ncbi:MAG: hypothetical protein NZM38_05430 [Cytophagales bacterium]|nr:hypothetical protein [Cytophagales bacterium]MDW8384196.1 hypothetical protein [Flammeovirgaceae bacterium]